VCAASSRSAYISGKDLGLAMRRLQPLGETEAPMY